MSNVYEKILAVQSAIKPVAKNGTLEIAGKKQYDFVKDADVLKAVKELANENGLVITASQESSETGFFEITKYNFTNQRDESMTRRWAKVRMLFCVVNADKPDEKVESYFDGYAEDTGDKAVPKAITSAGKYFHLKFFGVPTGDDLEADESVHEPSRIARAPQQRASIQAGNPEIDSLKQQFKDMVSNGVTSWTAITNATGVPSILRCTDIAMLKKALETMTYQINCKEAS